MSQTIVGNVNETLKAAIVTLLKNRQQLNMDCDLCCYPSSDNYYHVDYIYSEESIGALNITERERQLIMDEEELLEIFDTPEEAAEFYLRLCNNNINLGGYRCNSPKRTIAAKIASYNKDKYF